MVDQLGKLADIVDGILLSWVDHLAGLERWNREVMRRLEQAGLRRSPHHGQRRRRSALERDREKGFTGLDPGWISVFGKDHVPLKS